MLFQVLLLDIVVASDLASMIDHRCVCVETDLCLGFGYPVPTNYTRPLLKVLLPCQCGYRYMCAVCGYLVMEPQVSLLSAAAVTTQSSGGREAGHSLSSGDHELQSPETLAHRPHQPPGLGQQTENILLLTSRLLGTLAIAWRFHSQRFYFLPAQVNQNSH